MLLLTSLSSFLLLQWALTSAGSASEQNRTQPGLFLGFCSCWVPGFLVHSCAVASSQRADWSGSSAAGSVKVWSLQVSTWSVEELHLRLASLDPQMEQEIEEVRQRYQAKRKPILDAIEAKKRQQQRFWGLQKVPVWGSLMVPGTLRSVLTHVPSCPFQPL